MTPASQPLGWGRTVVVPCGLLGAALAACGAVAAGLVGALGSLLGTAVPVACLLLGQLVLRSLRHVEPVLLMVVALLSYGLQVVALLALYAAFTRHPEWDATVSSTWVGVGALVATVVSSALIIRVAKHERTPLFDVGDAS